MTPMAWAMQTIDRMQLQGRRCVVIVKQGKPYSGVPYAVFEGTREYPLAENIRAVPLATACGVTGGV